MIIHEIIHSPHTIKTYEPPLQQLGNIDEVNIFDFIKLYIYFISGKSTLINKIL